jgi:hypothetical protein
MYRKRLDGLLDMGGRLLMADLSGVASCDGRLFDLLARTQYLVGCRGGWLRLIGLAEKEGVQGVSVITPYFIKPTQSELIDHFRRVAESTSTSVILYNNPATCAGVRLRYGRSHQNPRDRARSDAWVVPQFVVCESIWPVDFGLHPSRPAPRFRIAAKNSHP